MNMHTNDALAVADRAPVSFDKWFERVSATYVPVRASLHDTDLRSSFRGNLFARTVGGIHLSEVSGGPVHIKRSLRDIRRADPGYLKIGYQAGGNALLSQNDRQVPMQPGDFVLYDTSIPYEIVFDGPFRMMVLMIPRHALDVSPRQLTTALLERFRASDGGTAALAAGFLQHVNLMVRTDSLPRRPRVTDAMLQLVSAAFEEHLDEPSVTGAREGLYLASKKYIDDNLHDCDLTPSTVAAAHHVSLRMLQSVFRDEGETVVDLIRSRRLERCRRDLADPNMGHWSISAICARHGLHNLSHFSHMFKERFGVAPREYRSSRRGAAADPRPEVRG
ncbi:helix-turn-helix domain-containing protein [Nocardia sp. NPDC050793]|uniref:AraC-like ligand-binding domain-containing protein n=1 Tax=Nocardia sp. NPDC050793 TaxID=3155159 RepID=UPI0033E5FA8E